MQRRSLPRAQRDVVTVGVGGKGLTGARRGLEPEDASRAIATAIEAGCEIVDLSCPGTDSDVLARVGREVRALRARDRVVVAPAVGEPGRRPPPAARLTREVEDALRALKLDAVPLVWLTGWDDRWLDDRTWPEVRGGLERLVREGKVLAWGAVVPDGGAPTQVLAERWLAAVQLRYSLFDRAAEEALLPAAAAAGVGVVAREPLAGGALAGELGPRTTWPPGDERATWSARWRALPPELARLAPLVIATPAAATHDDAGRALLDGLRRGPDLEQADTAELALRLALAHPAITAVIPGVRTPEHARAALACADGRPLPPRIKAALDSRRWGAGWYPRT